MKVMEERGGRGYRIIFKIFLDVCIILSYCERAEVTRTCSDLFKGISCSLSMHQASPFEHRLFSPFVGIASF